MIKIILCFSLMMIETNASSLLRGICGTITRTAVSASVRAQPLAYTKLLNLPYVFQINTPRGFSTIANTPNIAFNEWCSIQYVIREIKDHDYYLLDNPSLLVLRLEEGLKMLQDKAKQQSEIAYAKGLADGMAVVKAIPAKEPPVSAHEIPSSSETYDENASALAQIMDGVMDEDETILIDGVIDGGANTLNKSLVDNTPDGKKAYALFSQGATFQYVKTILPQFSDENLHKIQNEALGLTSRQFIF